MQWEAVNAMTFESATHRVRRVGDHWLAEVKPTIDGQPLRKIAGRFERQHDAQEACEADAYKIASGG